MPGASRLLRRLAAVDFGLSSTPGVLRPVTDGVMDARRLGLEGCGSTDAAAERREGGREGRGGVDSVLGATEARCTLAARVVGAGVGVFDCAATGVETVSFSGILMVPALGAAGSLPGAVTADAGGLDARGDGLGAVFCFFLAGSGSDDGDRDDVGVSSAFLFLDVFSTAFLAGLAVRLPVGVLAFRFNDANADAKGAVKRLRNFVPMSPSLLAASSAS